MFGLAGNTYDLQHLLRSVGSCESLWQARGRSASIHMALREAGGLALVVRRGRRLADGGVSGEDGGGRTRRMVGVLRTGIGGGGGGGRDAVDRRRSHGCQDVRRKS